jgi:hypothetical protein
MAPLRQSGRSEFDHGDSGWFAEFAAYAIPSADRLTVLFDRKP